MPEYNAGSSSTAAKAVAVENVDVEIKCSVFAFTYPTVTGNFTVPHNLPDDAKVVGFSIGIEYGGLINQFMPPSYDASDNFHYNAYVSSNSISIRSIADANLLGRSGSATIWYYQ